MEIFGKRLDNTSDYVRDCFPTEQSENETAQRIEVDIRRVDLGERMREAVEVKHSVAYRHQHESNKNCFRFTYSRISSAIFFRNMKINVLTVLDVKREASNDNFSSQKPFKIESHQKEVPKVSDRTWQRNQQKRVLIYAEPF